MVPELTALGFCGADDSVHPHHLALIAKEYRTVEFGVLFRPDKAGTPRYASSAFVERLSATAKAMQRDKSITMKLAAHLCSSRVNELLDGSTEFLQYLVDCGFQRVQINATAVNGVDTSKLAGAVPILWQIIQDFPVEFILQKNEETRPLWEGIENLLKLHPRENVAMLVDESKGTGVLSSSWPVPSKLYKTGYAGGIGPDNIRVVLDTIVQAVQQGECKTFWIDMESSLRSSKNGKDVFDLDKCFTVIDEVCTMGLMERPAFLK